MESQKIFFMIIFILLKDVLSLVFFYLVVLFYKPEIIGIVQFALSFVALFSFIFNLGFLVAHLKIYPEEENKAGSIGTLLFINTFFIIISLIFYSIVLNLFSFDSRTFTIIIIFLIDLIVQNMCTFFSNILIADKEIIKGTFPWIVISSSKIIFIIIGISYFPFNEIILSFFYLFSSLIHFIVLFIYVIPYKIGKPTKNLINKYLKFTYPLIVYNVVFIISSNIGFVLINFWISTEAVAFYYAGDHLSTFRTVIPKVIGLAMVSIFSKNIAENKLEKNKEIIKRISKYSCFLFGIVILLSFLYSNYLIIFLIGKVYEPSVFIFNILLLSHLIIINDAAIFADLNARGLTRLYSIINILGEIYQIFLIIIFIAPFCLNLGINGLALAILFRYITYTPFIRTFLWIKYKYSYNFSIFLNLAIILAIYLLNNLIFVKIIKVDLFVYFYLIPFFMLLNILLYFIILYVVRGIKRDDLRYFKLIFNIKSLINLLYKDLAVKINNSDKENNN